MYTTDRIVIQPDLLVLKLEIKVEVLYDAQDSLCGAIVMHSGRARRWAAFYNFKTEPKPIEIPKLKLTIKGCSYSSAGTAADGNLQPIVIPSASLLSNQSYGQGWLSYRK